ncbi:hypothetical protein [Actinomarinicola tropica]|uniref:Uncharacterized protein n=1 Tax=Actinomarinicola tropica TaxID=2789776 RepID=A0A5Q2RQN7_9ACTN|nr:hypothetical protein [Actinomarinicola tropica]QGG96746.1 hypothetical protein GH723_17505 [Actinomarinicola tropica]
MGRSAASRVLAVVALVALALGPSAACGSCDVACGEPRPAEEVRVLTAEVLEVDDGNGLVRVRSEDGAEREFRVRGRLAVLDEGTSYRFPVDDGWTALPDPCDCGGPYVTDLDGDVVDTAYLASWRDLDVVRIALVVSAVAIAAIASWGLARRRRGLPL